MKSEENSDVDYQDDEYDSDCTKAKGCADHVDGVERTVGGQAVVKNMDHEEDEYDSDREENANPVSHGNVERTVDEHVVVKKELGYEDEYDSDDTAFTEDMKPVIHGSVANNKLDYEDEYNSDTTEYNEDETPVNRGELQQTVDKQAVVKKEPDYEDVCDSDDRVFTEVVSPDIDKESNSGNCDQAITIYMCDICGVIFKNERNYLKHTKEGHNTSTNIEQSNECTECQKTFKTRYGLKQHARVHNTSTNIEQSYECTECQKTFKTRYGLKQHARVHTSYHCGPCNITISDSRIAVFHKSHAPSAATMPVAKHICALCGKCFDKASTLKRHTTYTHDERSHKCNTCGASFALKETFTKHLRTHTGEQPYKCSICNMSFSQKGSLIRHSRLHTNTKIYPCPLCTKKFQYKDNVKQHLLMAHAD